MLKGHLVNGCKDKFGGNEFSNWIKSIVDDHSNAVSPCVFSKVLQFVTCFCLGVLYDETVKNFCILGEDQARLVKMEKQPLSEPTVIYGLAGTGKTISILARIQHISSQLSDVSKAICLTFEDNALKMVKSKLRACNIDLTNITIANLSTSPYNLQDIKNRETLLQDLIKDNYCFIYMDSVEDFGMDWVNELLQMTLTTIKQKRPVHDVGDFWITFDPFQGLQDSHSLMKGTGNQMHWLGNLPDGILLEKGFKKNKILKLEECFRMPITMIEHLESERVLPTSDLPKSQDVKSLGVVEEIINFPRGYSLQTMADQLAEQLYNKVMKRGIHPGHCAIVLNSGAYEELFPSQDGGLPSIVQLVNNKLRAIPVKSQASHMLQISQDVEETLLYSKRKVNTAGSISVTMPLLSDTCSGVDEEDTVGYQAERHAEVSTSKSCSNFTKTIFRTSPTASARHSSDQWKK